MSATWTVPRCWPGETVAILGGGASLTMDQIAHCRDRCRVIAINRAYQRAPWADWLWGGDVRFWTWHPDALALEGIKIVGRTATPQDVAYWGQLDDLAAAGVQVICHSSRKYPAPEPRHEGCSADPGVVHGNNSCGCILSVIAHTGAARVLLLGIDGGGAHWHAGYEAQGWGRPNYAMVRAAFASYARDLEVEVINCSPVSRETLPFRYLEMEQAI